MRHLKRATLVALCSVAVVTYGLTVSASASGILAPPPKDCNTPNQNNGVGVLNTPQSMGTNGQPLLTKTLTQTVTGSGSTTYFFQLQTTRNSSNDSGSGASVSYGANTLTDTSKAWTVNQWANATVLAGGTTQALVASNTATTLTLTANWSATPAAQTPYVISFFSEVLDCAWDVTQGGNSNTASYAYQATAPQFSSSNGQYTTAIGVNNSDAICDRVELKGTDPNGMPFTDYSNLVGSPNGTTCTPSQVVPEAPMAALLLVGGALSVPAYLVVRRRRGAGGRIA